MCVCVWGGGGGGREGAHTAIKIIKLSDEFGPSGQIQLSRI